MSTEVYRGYYQHRTDPFPAQLNLILSTQLPTLITLYHLHDAFIFILRPFTDGVTAVINFTIVACVRYEWMLYLGAAISFLDYTSTTMFRSTITKNVHANEVGRVFSVVGTFQAMMPFAAGPLYGFLYK